MKPLLRDLKDIRINSRKRMRYETLGDYFNFGKIEVYEGMDKVSQLAVAVHELVELVLFSLQGVSQEEVDGWDTSDSGGEYDPTMYDKDPRYKEAHQFAEKVERKIVETAGLNWKEYNEALDKIEVKWSKKRLSLL